MLVTQFKPIWAFFSETFFFLYVLSHNLSLFHSFFLNFYFYFMLLYNTVLVLPFIKGFIESFSWPLIHNFILMIIYLQPVHSAPVAVAAGALRTTGEELPHVWGQGQRLRVPGCDGEGTAKRSHPTSEVMGNGLEEPPCVQGQGRLPGRSIHIQGAVAALAQEGLAELSHVEGQEGQRWGDTLPPR